MKRRLKIFGCLTAVLFYSLAYGEDVSLWEKYKSTFISKDGRVIDYYQSQVSHSESQGYGMNLSVMYNDRAAFDSLWQWTKNNLKVRSDNLFAWQWGKRSNEQWGVIDYNNATDGDILIAYALLKASNKWHENNYKNEALKIIEDIKDKLSVNRDGYTFLLPSYYGFIKDGGLILNPSYLIFPAYRHFAQEHDRPFWEKIYKDSMYLLAKNCFGRLCLPADWIVLTDKRISIFTEKSALFGSEAIRVFLYLSSEKSPRFPRGVEKILDIYNTLGYIPLWVNLEQDSFSLEHAMAGYYAVYAFAAKRLGDEALSKRLFKEAQEKLKKEKNSYYSFSLYLLTNSGDTL